VSFELYTKAVAHLPLARFSCIQLLYHCIISIGLDSA